MHAKLRQIPYYGMLGLLIYMPFHIFISQWLSTLTGGLSAWKVGKDVITVLLVSLCVGWVWYFKLASRQYWWLVGLSLAYLAVHFAVYYVNRDTSLGIATLATVYNNRLLWYLIIGVSCAVLLPAKLNMGSIINIVISVSTLVCILGIIQFLLPQDILTHFGYSVERGVKQFFFIDNKPDLTRIMSTLREPNSLGAYLILPCTILLLSVTDAWRQRKNVVLWAGLLGINLLALFLTFSRSAWLGAMLAMLLAAVFKYRQLCKKMLKTWWPALVFMVAALLSAGYIMRDQYFVQNALFHSDENTVSAQDSNDKHLNFAETGVRGIIKTPLGHGPGTAGPVSLHTPSQAVITENYFLQIGYEAGIVGLGILLFIHIKIYRALKSQKSLMGICLLASFWGLILCNMLLHTWSNEAVAAQWWGLAGIVIGTKLRAKSAKHQHAVA